MENTIAHSHVKYRVETWECTDEDCLRAGQTYRFEDEAHNYGTGPLTGQVDPKRAVSPREAPYRLRSIQALNS